MSAGKLDIDLGAIVANWVALNRLSATGVETSAVVKANGYGLGVGPVARALASAGVRTFFVANSTEGRILRRELDPSLRIFVLSGHMNGDTRSLADASLAPVLNSPDQLARHAQNLPGHPFAVQLDTGMNRLGIEPEEWGTARGELSGSPDLIMSHLACADEPDHAMNRKQLKLFSELTSGFQGTRSLAATGGILLGQEYHFDLTRPGIGLYGGLPFENARAVVRLELPVIQTRNVVPGETIGYGNTWTAKRPARIATVAGGYADGIHRVLSNQANLYSNGQACPLVGRVSMDLITVDVTELDHEPETLALICEHQGIDALADRAGTIGYEILTSLAPRLERRYHDNR